MHGRVKVLTSVALVMYGEEISRLSGAAMRACSSDCAAIAAGWKETMKNGRKGIAAIIAIWMAMSTAAFAQYRDDRGYDNGYYPGQYGDHDRDYDHDGAVRYGYDNGGYYDRGGYYPDYLRQAGDAGYHDGLRNGARDRRNGKRFRPTHGEDYEHAMRGYNSVFRDKQGYRNAYRDGYQRGYQRGYGEGYRW